MEPLYLPTLHYFENKNRFSGSFGLLRFMVTPKVEMLNRNEVNFQESCLNVQLWHGLFCLEKSTVELEESFPLSMEGMEALRAWLMEHK
ncbi:MAG: hypothetical protein R3Y62_06835 [Eubacteriales bacterium]